MAIVLTAAVLLMFSSLSFGVDVEVVTKSEPRIEVDTTPHMVQAEEDDPSDNQCISKKTCGECIRQYGCAWCASQDMNYTDGGRKRCNDWRIIEKECGREDRVIPSTTISREDSRGRVYYDREGDEMFIYISFFAKRDLPFVAFGYDNVPENVQVTGYGIYCRGHEWEENKTSCTDVKKGNRVEFDIKLIALSCPENRDEWNPIMQFYTLKGSDNVVIRKVNLGILCKCECEMPEKIERNSPKCSGRGMYTCGVCRCPDNWYGKQCECEGKPNGNSDDDKDCIAPGDNKICSGRGRCCSGICRCLNKTTGRFCESDACPQSEDGQICGGSYRGKCVCGRCECTDEWTGPACDCTKDIESCRSPYNGIICHGFGECKCGKCECFEKDGIPRSGRFCQDCGICIEHPVNVNCPWCQLLSCYKIHFRFHYFYGSPRQRKIIQGLPIILCTYILVAQNYFKKEDHL